MNSILVDFDCKKHTKNDVIIEGFSLAIGHKKIIDSSLVKFIYKERYGIIGDNGVGKSVFLKSVQEGHLKIPSEIDYILCEQDPVSGHENESIMEYVLSSDKRRTKLIQRREKLEQIQHISPKQVKQLDNVNQELNAHGEGSVRARVTKILHGLGLKDVSKKIKNLSGGLQMRASFARALFMEPKLLLLDEPSNHLDTMTTRWLANYLKTYKHTVVVITHDRFILSELCTKFIHLKDRQLIYSRKPPQPVTFTLSTIDSTESDSRVYSAIVLSEFRPFGRISIGIDTRLAVLGQNGSGKSTFLKTLVCENDPRIYRHPELKIGYLPQTVNKYFSPEDFSKSGQDYLIKIGYHKNNNNTNNNTNTNNFFKIFEFTQFETPLCDLSGGMLSTFTICVILQGRPDILILDEPTNNLDLGRLDTLIFVLKEFKGGIVFTSHCVHFVESLKTESLEF